MGGDSAQVATVIGSGAVSSVGSQGSTLAVEREWVKALCAGDSALLARKNSGKRKLPMLSVRKTP